MNKSLENKIEDILEEAKKEFSLKLEQIIEEQDLMEEEEKIYIITERDDYSHCEILAICSTREKAEEYVKGTRNIQCVGYCKIEEWALDLPEDGWLIVLVAMAKNGDVDYATQGINDGFGYRGFNVIGELVWAVKTRDNERAIKVVNEKREIILEKGIWWNDVACKELFNKKMTEEKGIDKKERYK